MTLPIPFCHAYFRTQGVLFDCWNGLSENSTSLLARIPIDHFNDTDARTYTNRYWINATYYLPGSPVLFRDIGESAVTKERLDAVLTEQTANSSLMTLARRYHGVAVVWEHRYYGDSLPIRNMEVESEDKYQYLGTEQALEDVAYFANNFRPAGLEKYWTELNPLSTPWIWIGGSYSGTRGAFMRLRNPEIFYAIWSSSPSVQVTVHFPEYYIQVGRNLPRLCLAAIQAAIAFVDGVLTDGSVVERVRLRFEMARSWPHATLRQAVAFALTGSNYDVAVYLRGIIPVDFQSLGMAGFMNTTCEILYDHYGRKDSLKLQRMPRRAFASLLEQRIAFTRALDAVSANIVHFQSGHQDIFFADAASWQWQVCSEYGYFQVADPKSAYNVLSKFLTGKSLWGRYCAARFPGLTFPPTISAPLKYGGWNMHPSNVMFTAGSRDPWHNLGVQTPSLASDAPNRTTTRNVPLCNVPPPSDTTFGLLFSHGYHSGDLIQDGGESDLDAIEATNLFAEALDDWLPCFNYNRAN